MQLKLRNNIYDECYLGLSKQEYIEKNYCRMYLYREKGEIMIFLLTVFVNGKSLSGELNDNFHMLVNANIKLKSLRKKSFALELLYVYI